MEQKRKMKFNKKSLYTKFIGFLIKNGNRCLAKNLIEKTLFLVSKKFKTSLKVVFLCLFLKLNMFVEIKKIKIRKRSIVIPFSLSLKRRSYLVIKLLLQALKSKKKIFAEILSKEMVDVLSKSKSKTLNLVKTNNKGAFLNRSNFHYRW